MQWIVVTNQCEARLYQYSSKGGFEFMDIFRNPLGRARIKQIKDDKYGDRWAKYLRSAIHTLDGEKDPHRDAELQFARLLYNNLSLEMKKHPKLKLKVIAEPKLLGMIRKHFRKTALIERVEWLDKDLNKVPRSRWPKLISLGVG